MRNTKLSNARYRAGTKLLKQAFYQKVGLLCMICGHGTQLKCHRKDWSKHERIANLTRRKLSLEDPRDYVRLCFRCHFGVHWIHDQFGLGWIDIEALHAQGKFRIQPNRTFG